MPRLPARLDGVRVLHLSDLHLHAGPQGAWQIPALVATTRHDLICYTGDFIDSDDDLPRLARFLERMPRGAPAYAVLGNHDYTPYGRGRGVNDVRRLRRTLAAAGITILTNEARPLYGEALYLVGVDDPATGRDNLARALARAPASACSLLLAHSPDIVLRLGAYRPSVILAGHTHGGQIRLPLVGALLTESHIPRRLAMGLHTYHGAQLFVSRGIGYSGLDIRIGCPPEVAVLTFRSPATAVIPM
ncbi:MAG TPA: metallophosphoesterase [Chloroflexota bacterium]|nr:metallophosphoesterase [Chloroflexota bacterium]